MEIFKCLKCGKIICVLKNSSCGTFCCNEEMVELKANVVDAAVEKHVPVVDIDGSKVLVKVGEIEHPMLEEHYIEWIILETNRGYQLVNLKPGDKPEIKFNLIDEENVVSAYAYCNLHGLWKKDM